MLQLLYASNIIVADSRSADLPIISARHRKLVINRDRVRQFQIQSIVKSAELKNIEKRETLTTPVDSKQLTQIYGENIPWDIVKKQVPFHALLNHNIEQKPGERARRNNPFNSADLTRCRRKRGDDNAENDIVRRNLKTPAGEGILPAVGMQGELCEDTQPVEVVKIEKLVIEDGVIRDQNIIEKAMFT